MRGPGRLPQPRRRVLDVFSARNQEPVDQAGQRGQAGFSLVEVLIAVMLVGTVILSLAAGMLTLVRTSGSTSERQQMQLALGSVTENMLVAPYVPCQYIPAAATTPPDIAIFYNGQYHGWSGSWHPDPARRGMSEAKITSVEFWNTDADGNGTTDGAFTATCPPPPAPSSTVRDQGIQRVTVQITYKGRTTSAQVVTSARVTP